MHIVVDDINCLNQQSFKRTGWGGQPRFQPGRIDDEADPSRLEER
jgi:hypothetical protein